MLFTLYKEIIFLSTKLEAALSLGTPEHFQRTKKHSKRKKKYHNQLIKNIRATVLYTLHMTVPSCNDFNMTLRQLDLKAYTRQSKAYKRMVQTQNHQMKIQKERYIHGRRFNVTIARHFIKARDLISVCCTLLVH